MQIGCRSRRARVVALGGAAALAALAGGGATAQAAWLSAGSASGIGSGSSILTAGAGVATLSGVNVDSTLIGATHTPGTTMFGTSFAVTAANEEATAPIGPGGAVVASGSDGTSVRRLHADGAPSAPVLVGDDTTSVVGGVAAVAPGGAAIALVSNEDDQAQIWRQASDGAAFAPIGGVVGANATVAAIAPTGPDSFVVIFAEPRDPAGSHLRALRVTGTTVSAARTIDSQASLDEFSYETLKVSGSTAAFVVAAQEGSTLMTANVDTGVAGAALAGPLGEDDGFLDLSLLPVPGGGTAVAWTQTSGDGAASGYGLVRPDGGKFCATGEPFTSVALVDRGGPLLVGLGADGTVGTVPVAGDCAPGTPSAGPNLGAGEALAAGVDADGALIVGVSSTQETEPFGSTTALAVDDATAPSLDVVQVPATVDAGAPFKAYVRASDAWGLGAITWTVDGKTVATGTDATIPAQEKEGAHTIGVTVKNAAGLASSREGAFVVVPSGTAPPPPPAPPVQTLPTPTTPPAPTAPVGGASTAKDTTAPQVSGLRVLASLVRPMATGHKGGTTLRMTLSEDARVRVTLLRGKPVPGGKSRCTAWVGPAKGAAKSKKAGQLLQVVKDVRGGTVSVSLSGRFADGSRLPRGRYRISVRASDRAGNLSPIAYTWMTLC